MATCRTGLSHSHSTGLMNLELTVLQTTPDIGLNTPMEVG